MKPGTLLAAIAAIIGLFVLLGSYSASADEVTTIDAGGGYGPTCAVVSGGQMWCWGDNDSGQLGIGVTGGGAHSRPTKVCSNAACSAHLMGVAHIAVGVKHTCAVLSDSSLMCWGANDSGALGIGTMGGSSTIPVSVCADSACTAHLQNVKVVSASGALGPTCAVTTGGGVKCWGHNFYGAVGDGTTSHRTAPVDVTGLTSGVVTVAAAKEHTCALTTAGGVKCWGNPNQGRLGNGESGCCPARTAQDVVGLGSGVQAIDAFHSHSCALTSGGGVKCWGFNGTGQLGDGTRDNIRSTPIDVVGLSSGVMAIALGSRHSCALTTAGGMKCWGSNRDGQLGDGTTTERDSPVDVQGLSSGVTAITAGDSSTCALLDDGSAKCWGNNVRGQLGNGETTGRTSPVAVVDLKSSLTPTQTPLRTPTRTPTPCLPNGDANDDGVVNSIDAALVLQHSAGLVSSLPCEESADVNHDGNINAVDAAIILQYVAGLIDDLPN